MTATRTPTISSFVAPCARADSTVHMYEGGAASIAISPAMSNERVRLLIETRLVQVPAVVPEDPVDVRVVPNGELSEGFLVILHG